MWAAAVIRLLIYNHKIGYCHAANRCLLPRAKICRKHRQAPRFLLLPQISFSTSLKRWKPLRHVLGVQVSGRMDSVVFRNRSLSVAVEQAIPTKVLLDGYCLECDLGGTVEFGAVFTTGIDQIDRSVRPKQRALWIRCSLWAL